MGNFETAQELFDALCMPFAPEEIDWRVGSTTQDKSKGMALAYLDARAVMDRLDAVCGSDGWRMQLHRPSATTRGLQHGLAHAEPANGSGKPMAPERPI
jgi:hypothetical protein